MPAGFRVVKRRRTVDAAWIDKFRRIPVANISDSMFRLSAGDDVTNSIIGERMPAYCQAKGFGGIVINGALRDVGYIQQRAEVEQTLRELGCEFES